MMKLTFLLCCVGVLQVSAFSYAQTGTVSLRVKEASVRSILQMIEAQSEYTFVYNNEQVNHLKPVSLDVKNEKITFILDECLKDTDLSYELMDKVIVINRRLNIPQATVTVQGIVRDKKGNPLPGVSIYIKGTTVGVATDGDGKFKMDIPKMENTILVFSFVGMKIVEEKLKDQKNIQVTLEEETNEMEEVVVNGLFTQNRNSYTGAVTTVKGEDLLRVSQTNFFQALSTLTPGLRIMENNDQGSNPNHIPEIIIRGTTSIASQGELGLNRPLIMLDGVEITLEQLYDLDMYEIERVDVLKDASATALYGDKAANGVIVVQRKKVTDSKLRVRYNFVPNVQFPDVSSFNLCNAEQKLELERLYGEYNDVKGEKDEEYNRKYQLVKSGVNTDWKSKPLRNSWSFKHSLSVTGRGGGVDYGINLSYGDTRGVMKGDFHQTYGIGFYFSYNVAEKLNLNYRSNWTETDAKNSPYGSFADFVRINPYDTPKDEYGNWNETLSFGFRNPLYDATTGGFSKSVAKNFTNSLGARWDIIKNLYATGTFSYTQSETQNDEYDSPTSSTWSELQEKSQKGSYTITGSKGNSWNLTYALNYSKLFGQENTTVLSLHGGGTASHNRRSNFSFMGVGFLKPEFDDLSYASSYPASGKPSGAESISTSVGWYVNLNFIYDNRYFIDGSFRTSGGSNYGTDNLYSPYWSCGVGWNAQNEEFLKNSWVNLLRFRLSVGYVGSSNFGGIKPMTIYQYDPDNTYYTGLGAVPTSMGNDQLKAQRTLTWNGGVGISLFDSRVEVNLDGYKQISKDLLLSISLPPSAGISSTMANLGESENWGIEWSVSGQIIKKTDMFWRITVNGSKTRNKITKISSSLKRQNSENRDEVTLSAPKFQYEEGESQDAIYAVRSLGIDPATGREIFIRKDGTYTFNFDPQDKVAVGISVPKMQGSIMSSFAWKSVSVNVALSYTWGGDIYNTTRAAKIENIDYRVNVDKRALTERWIKAGDVVDYIRIDPNMPYNHSERFVERRNELYLSSLGINYDINPSWVNRIGLKKLMIGVTFSDVLRLSTVKYERGTSYPYMRGFNFTVSPTF